MLTKSETENTNGHHRGDNPQSADAASGAGATSGSSDPIAFQPIAWHESAPARVRESYALGSRSEGWEQWAKYLDKRDVKSPQSLLPSGRKSLAWGLEERLGPVVAECLASQAADIARLAKSIRSATSETLMAWLGKLTQSPLTLATAIEALAWAHALPCLVGQIEQVQWTQLLGELARLADESKNAADTDPLIHQLMAGELPLTLAYQLPEVATCRDLGTGALQTLTDGLAEILDGEGLPNCRHLDSLRGLLACWTRCRVLGRERPDLCWDDTTQTQYCWVVREPLRLTRRSGSQIFSADCESQSATKLFKAARELAMDAEVDKLAALVFGKGKSEKASGKQGKAEVAAPAVESEWSELALLRTSWASDSPSLAIAYGGRQVRCELAIGDELLTQGTWNLTLKANGAECLQESEWEQVCWVSDEDVDYLELEAKFTGDVRVQRQILLGRKDRFLLLADAVLSTQPATRFEYTSRIALSEGVEFKPAAETREGQLLVEKVAASVLPLALPEWRIDPRGGALSVVDHHLQLQQAAQGQCMFAPLFLGLDRKWIGKELTWRQLTVAEVRESQPADVAVGYRVQIGKLQWLIYRSLARPGMRHAGQNLSSEFLAGRFHKTEPFSTYVDIEY